MPIPSEGRVTVSGKPSKAVELLRKRLRLSLGAMMIIVLVIGGTLGWVVRRARVQRDAVAAITYAGGQVVYDWEWKNGKLIPGRSPWAPRWLVELIGVDYFGHVVAVVLPSTSTPTDAVIAQVGLLTRLERLGVYVPSFSDSMLARLGG